MKALRLEAIGRLKSMDIPPPPSQPDEVVLRVSHCAVCRTDAKMWHQGQRDLVLPRILGHEICAFDEASGDRFVVWPGKACGKCDHCLAGAENLCQHMSILGFHSDGGYAELVAAPSSSLIPVPSDLPGHLACLTEPLGCALNALEQLKLTSGKSVLIYGGGPLGLLLAMAAREWGAEPSLVELNRAKLGRSEEFRANLGIADSFDGDLTAFDAVINATPSFDTFPHGLSRLKAGGWFCLFSGFSKEDSVPASLINEIHYRQLHVVGAYGCTRAQMAKALILIRRRRNDLERLIEDRIGLEQLPAALSAVLSGQALKYVVEF